MEKKIFHIPFCTNSEIWTVIYPHRIIVMQICQVFGVQSTNQLGGI